MSYDIHTPTNYHLVSDKLNTNAHVVVLSMPTFVIQSTRKQEVDV